MLQIGIIIHNNVNDNGNDNNDDNDNDNDNNDDNDNDNDKCYRRQLTKQLISQDAFTTSYFFWLKGKTNHERIVIQFHLLVLL